MSDFKEGDRVRVIEHPRLEPKQRARLGQVGKVTEFGRFPGGNFAQVEFKDGQVQTYNAEKLDHAHREFAPPDEFYFVTGASRPGAVYHAAKTPEGDYRVSWSLALGHKGTGSNLYSYNEVRGNLRSGCPNTFWNIVEAPAAPEPTLDERIAGAVAAVVDATRARNDQSARAHTAQQAVDLERRALEKARNAQEDAERELSKLLDLKARQS